MRLFLVGQRRGVMLVYLHDAAAVVVPKFVHPVFELVPTHGEGNVRVERGFKKYFTEEISETRYNKDLYSAQ